MPSPSHPVDSTAKPAAHPSPATRAQKKVRASVNAPVADSQQPTPRTAPRKKPIPTTRSGQATTGDEVTAPLPKKSRRRFHYGRCNTVAPEPPPQPQSSLVIVTGSSSSEELRPRSQHQRTDQDRVDTTSSDFPPLSRPAAGKNPGGRPIAAGSRCDFCTLSKRGCDGVRPVCGRCEDLGKECVWREEKISRRALEGMKRSEEGDGERRKLIAMRVDHLKALKAKEESLKKAKGDDDIVTEQGDGATLVEREEAQNDTSPTWTYGDHCEMMETISEASRGDPAIRGEVLGHGKGNRIFDDATKAFEEHGGLDEDENENVNMDHTHMYDGLKLNWGESEDKRGMPDGSLSDGPGLPSNLRKRLGLPEYPAQSVEVPEVQVTTRREPVPKYEDAMRVANLGEDDLSWMDDWPQGSGWNDGGRLPEPNEASDFSWADELLNADLLDADTIMGPYNHGRAEP